ncbi:hypothetical protein [Carboxylicivirga sp. RSCT41]|uniref:hypothetical protein n=1 Tax=Carboxylicivirga agarovorans TaxID=3417570 RepID=UPI003D335618
MIGTILKLLDTLKNGINFYKDSKKSLFSNYLEPSMKDFQTVHENYLLTFKEYLELLMNSEIPLNKNHPVLNKIRNDSLFSEDLRNKVFSYYDYSNKDSFSNFNNSIIRYFQSSIKVPFFDSAPYLHSPNSARIDLYGGLINIISDEGIVDKSEKAIEQTRYIVSELQANYRKVLDNYNSLKNELIM